MGGFFWGGVACTLHRVEEHLLRRVLPVLVLVELVRRVDPRLPGTHCTQRTVHRAPGPIVVAMIPKRAVPIQIERARDARVSARVVRVGANVARVDKDIPTDRTSTAHKVVNINAAYEATTKKKETKKGEEKEKEKGGKTPVTAVSTPPSSHPPPSHPCDVRHTRRYVGRACRCGIRENRSKSSPSQGSQPIPAQQAFGRVSNTDLRAFLPLHHRS